MKKITITPKHIKMKHAGMVGSVTTPKSKQNFTVYSFPSGKVTTIKKDKVVGERTL